MKIAVRLWQVIQPHQRWIWWGLILLLATAACRLTLPYLVKLAVDDHLVPGQLEGFGLLMAFFLGTAIFEVVCRRSQLIALETAGQNALLDLRLKVFRHLQQLPARFYDKTPIGRLVGRVTTDIEALQEMFSSGVVTIFGDLIFLAAATVLLLELSAELTLTTILMVPALVLTTMFVRQRVRRAYSAMREQLSQLNGFLYEQVSGMPIVQMFAQEANRTGDFAKINYGVQDAQLKSVRWESLLSAATEMLGFYTTALILWYGGGLAAEEVIPLGTLLAFVQYMGHFFTPLTELSLKYTAMQNALVASERIFALLDETPETPDSPDSAPLQGKGTIEFRNIHFEYNKDKPVLRDISFQAKAGESIAIVGATGSGKSTLLNLLTRLYEPQEGQILVDGVDITQAPRTDLRRRIGVVPQDVFLFQGNILDNIRLGHPNISDAEAIRAADKLHLDEIVARFPGGYFEPLAERGKNLSSGEKQLIAFARMLVVAPRILALDEATSNVDSHTEQLLQEAVQRLMVDRTSIIIAHRLSTIRDVDRILVLHEGELVESGNHDDLLAARGVYWRLDQMQHQDAEG